MLCVTHVEKIMYSWRHNRACHLKVREICCGLWPGFDSLLMGSSHGLLWILHMSVMNSLAS